LTEYREAYPVILPRLKLLESLEPKNIYLAEILIIAILSVITGAEGWEDRENYGISKQKWLYQFSKYRLQIKPTEYEFVQQLKQSPLWSLPPISEQSRALIHPRKQVKTISILFLDIAKSVQSDLIQDNEAVGASE
jgi:hypothetical protein